MVRRWIAAIPTMIFWSGFVPSSLCKELIHGKAQNQKALPEIGHQILGRPLRLIFFLITRKASDRKGDVVKMFCLPNSGYV